MLPFLRKTHNQRDMCAGVVDVAFGSRQDAAMIGIIKDNRVLTNTFIIQFIEPLPDLFVHRRDDVHVGHPVLTDFGCVGVMCGKLDRRRISARLLRDRSLLAVTICFVGEQAAFMADRRIKDSEEWLALGSVLPVCFGATFVPVAFVVGPKVVVGLGSVDTVVPRLTKEGWISAELIWNGIAATHVVCAIAACVSAQNECVSRNSTDGSVGIGVLVSDPVGGQSVDVGC